jgi:glycosyltransferase involved in cell wall biosynthesis
LARAVERVDDKLQELGYPYKLLIAEDGSTDDTFWIARGLIPSYPNLQVVHNDSKLGRGRALRNAWLSNKADVYVFMDADLATDLSFLPKLVDLMQSNGLDFVTGSRYCPGSRVQRPTLRKSVSLAYNAIVKSVFHTRISDHQCGFKAFSKRAITNILPLTKENGWAWDTEVIVYLARLGFRMAELPVDWKEMKGERTPIRRLLNDIREQSVALVRILVRSRRLRRI